LEDLNYSAPSDQQMELGMGQGSSGNKPQAPKNRATMTSRSMEDQKLNRADRRKSEKKGRR